MLLPIPLLFTPTLHKTLHSVVSGHPVWGTYFLVGPKKPTCYELSFEGGIVIFLLFYGMESKADKNKD